MTTDKIIVSNPQNKDFSNSVVTEDELWTTECLADKLLLRLAEIKETIINKDTGRKIHVRKYYRQARELFKWIPIAKPSPAFVIYISDLTPEIRNEIVAIDSEDTLTYALKQAVGRIFENLDFDYYHLSIAKNLKVKLQK